MNDKIDRLLEAVGHPERFTDEELADLLSDPEVRELYDLMSKTTDALTPAEDPDIDSEWQRFAAEHVPGYRPALLHILRVFFNRHAAAVILAAVASIAVVAATVTFTRSKGSHNPSDMGVQPTVSTPDIAKVEGEVLTDTILVGNTSDGETVTFKDEPFGSIISALEVHYGVKVTFNSPDTKKLRLFFKWDSSLPLSEVVDQLNSFEQINIRIKGNSLIVD